MSEINSLLRLILRISLIINFRFSWRITLCIDFLLFLELFLILLDYFLIFLECFLLLLASINIFLRNRKNSISKH